MNLKGIIGALALTAVFSAASAQKHYIDVTVGGGLQGSAVSPSLGTASPGLGWNAGAGYRFMFHPNWGVGTGVGLASYSTKAELDGVRISCNDVDSENGQDYTRHTDFDDWEERQNILAFEVPLAVCFVKPFSDKVSFKGDLGAKLVLPVKNDFEAEAGEVKVTGYYPATNITYEGLPQHGFRSFKAVSGEAGLEKFATAAFLGAGVQYALKGASLYLGAYFCYGINSLTKETDRPLLAEGGTYNGVFSSNVAGKSHLLSAGLKLGVSFGFPRTSGGNEGAPATGGDSEPGIVMQPAD